MKVTRQFFLLFFGLILVNTAFSQEQSVEDKAKEMTETMQGQIGFNKETSAKVYDINLSFVEDLQDVKANENSKIKKFKAIKSLQKEREDALGKVLTEAEFEAFEKYKKENFKAIKEKVKSSRT